MVEYQRPGAEAVLLALVQPYLHNGTEGWKLALTSLRDLYADAEESHSGGAAERVLAVEEAGGSFTSESARLGDITAQMHLALGAPLAPGLTDYLRGEADEMAAIQYGNNENLCFMPGGSQVANPSELLSNGRLKFLLDRVTPIFDWVIVDSSPCLLVADASMVADFSTGVLLVVRVGSTSVDAAQKVCQQLRRKNIIGVVLNGAEQQELHGSYYSAYGYGEAPERAIPRLRPQVSSPDSRGPR